MQSWLPHPTLSTHSPHRPPCSPDVRAGCSIYTGYCWHPDILSSCLGFCGTGCHYLALADLEVSHLPRLPECLGHRLAY